MRRVAVVASAEYNPKRRHQYYLKYKEKAKEYSTFYNRKKRYGISKESYQELLEKQQGVCAICFNSCSKALAVDHDHKTGVIRGLLCNKCNRGLGYLQDDLTLLRRAIDYLEANRGGRA